MGRVWRPAGVAVLAFNVPGVVPVPADDAFRWAGWRLCWNMLIAAIMTSFACWGRTNVLAVPDAAAVVARFHFRSMGETCVDARPKADSFGQRAGGQGDEEGSLFPKWSSINYWEVRVVGDKSLQNFSVWLIIVGHVNNAPHGIVGRSEVGGDICAASAERDGSELGISPRPSLHRGAECEGIVGRM